MSTSAVTPPHLRPATPLPGRCNLALIVRFKEKTMKNGKCPSCGSTEVYKAGFRLGYRNYVNLSMLSAARLASYICCGCGLVEDYLHDMNDVEKIKMKCEKVETTG